MNPVRQGKQAKHLQEQTLQGYDLLQTTRLRGTRYILASITGLIINNTPEVDKVHDAFTQYAMT